jgi:antitoxin (DNA-binding transcriptional repressor) of toxin-antitoxin stability system
MEGIMPKTISITECARSFSEVIGRVNYRREEFNIKKGKQIVARLIPGRPNSNVLIKDLGAIFKNGPHLDQEDTYDLQKTLTSLRKMTDNLEANKWE